MPLLSEAMEQTKSGYDNSVATMTESPTGEYSNPVLVPPEVGVTDPSPELLQNGNDSGFNPTVPGGETVEDLYPGGGTGAGGEGDIGPVVGADAVGPGIEMAEVTETDKNATNIDAQETELTDEQRVDAELARILGQDSPLLAQARSQAAQMANRRGLQNTSIGAGMGYDAMVRAALPMAQQNAAQGFQRESANTANRQRAQELMAQMDAALAQQDAEAYNRAAIQLSELNYRASQAEADAVNQRNSQIIDSVTRLNQQYLQNMGNADIATIQGTYQQLIAVNQTAGQIYNGMLNAMGNIMDNPDMTPTQVATAIGNMQRMMEASLRMIAEMNNMDFNIDIPGVTGGTGGTGGGGGPGGGGGRRGR